MAAPFGVAILILRKMAKGLSLFLALQIIVIGGETMYVAILGCFRWHILNK